MANYAIDLLEVVSAERVFDLYKSPRPNLELKQENLIF